MGLKTYSLQHTAKQIVECHEIVLPNLESGQVRARALCSGISTGTETLVFRGEIEPETQLDESLNCLKGSTTQYPFSYGYAWVGVIEEVGQKVEHLSVGDRVFAFAPHQNDHILDATECIKLPPSLESHTATLLPSMETALSIVQDAGPVAGEEICIFGQGLIGLLTTWVLSGLRLKTLRVVEPMKERHEKSIEAGAHEAMTPSELQSLQPVDTTIEVSGNPEALSSAMDHTRPNGKVIVASWYGTRTTELSLGTHFHRGRLKLISSQVSNLNPALEGTWDKSRRLNYALELLMQFPKNILVTEQILFRECQSSYPAALNTASGLTHTYFKYGD